MKWSTTEPTKTGYYVVETTTSMGSHNVMRAKFTIKNGKSSWAFRNQVFKRYLVEY